MRLQFSQIMMTKLIAVIHYFNDELALRNAEIAINANFVGVCLIHMDGEDEKIEPVAIAIKKQFPELLVFTNRLLMNPAEMIERDYELGLDGSWSDNPGVSSSHILPISREIMQALKNVRKKKHDFQFFGSVAFKTQRHEPYPDRASINASDLGWIATTSGPQTGSPPSADKLRMMKTALGSKPLAVASGVDPDNAAELLPFVDWAFVATGISSSFYELDIKKAKLLTTNMRISQSV